MIRGVEASGRSRPAPWRPGQSVINDNPLLSYGLDECVDNVADDLMEDAIEDLVDEVVSDG